MTWMRYTFRDSPCRTQRQRFLPPSPACFSSCSSSSCVRPDYSPEALADQVDWSSLPGAESLEVKDGFNMFSGYINVDQESGRNIFYWFMEAQDKPEDAPVVSAIADPEFFPQRQ